MKSEKRHHYVYKTINLINQKYYIGKHSTNDMEDDYLGSGKAMKRAIKKHGKENFTKEILSQHESSDDAFVEEATIVTEEIVNDPQSYNMVVGGSGGCKTEWTDEKKQAMSKKLKGSIPWMKNNNHSEKTKQQMSESAKRRSNNQTGLKRSTESKQKMSDAWDDNRKDKLVQFNKTKWTPESRQKLSESQIGVSVNAGFKNPSKKVVYEGQTYFIYQLARMFNKKSSEVAEFLNLC